MKRKEHSIFSNYLAAFLARNAALTREDECRKFSRIIKDLCDAVLAGHSCLEVSEMDAALVKKSLLASHELDKPLVLSGQLLYLQRYFVYEKRLAQQLLVMGDDFLECDVTLIDRLFGQENGEINYQRKAAELALLKRLCIITGGPGTGKTTTIVKILLLYLAGTAENARIGLAAPTGKAALRLGEAITSVLDGLDVERRLKDRIPVQPLTLHRLLGSRKNSIHFSHNRDNPLPYDLVVLDEASMVDLGMMSRLVDSLKAGCRLILLGDRDQLSSVEAGTVLADCVASLSENVVELRKSFRFDMNIKSFSECIIGNRAEDGWKLLEDAGVDNLRLSPSGLKSFLFEKYERYFSAVKKNSGEIDEIYSCFQEFQILCCLKKGSRGVEGVNRLIENELARQGVRISADGWYHGRPVMVGRNDYGLGLFNGDVGICLFDEEISDYRVWFLMAGNKYRSFPSRRIGDVETAFAMTVHKSQGSEFDAILMVMPQKDNRLLSRELLYTGVTRAKKDVILASSKEIFTLSLSRRVRRFGGLYQMLQKDFCK